MKSLIKIVLKTKDENFFLDTWIKYHASLIGEENLVIVDDHSLSEKTLNIYDNFKGKLFKTPEIWKKKNPVHACDNVHIPNFFPELYDYLISTSYFFTIIDTDEFLCFFDYQNNVVDNSKFLKFFKEHPSTIVVNPPWLYNYYYGTDYEKVIDVTDIDLRLTEQNASLGKMIINTEFLKTNKNLIVGHNNAIIRFPDAKVNIPSIMLLHLIKTNFESRLITKIAYTNFKSADEAFTEIEGKLARGNTVSFYEKEIFEYLKDREKFLAKKSTMRENNLPTLVTDVLSRQCLNKTSNTSFKNFNPKEFKGLITDIFLKKFKSQLEIIL